MQIINDKDLTTLSRILIMLTPSEASELASKIKSIDPNIGEHIHVDDQEYSREITIAVYTDQNLHYFTKEIRELIKAP
jgi:uncharacterized protein YegJ (DUF2314 family)